ISPAPPKPIGNPPVDAPPAFDSPPVPVGKAPPVPPDPLELEPPLEVSLEPPVAADPPPVDEFAVPPVAALGSSSVDPSSSLPQATASASAQSVTEREDRRGLFGELFFIWEFLD